MNIFFQKSKNFLETFIPNRLRCLLQKEKQKILIKIEGIIDHLPKKIRKRVFLYYLNIRKIVTMTPVNIISYPKSGRTWLRVLIGKAICDKYNFSDRLALETPLITQKAGLSWTKFIHDDASFDKYDYDQLPHDKSKYLDKKVILLIRDIKDTLVSSYYQLVKREFKYTGTISNFIRSKAYGVKKIVHFLNIWYYNRNIPMDFLLMRYEDIHKNPHEALRKVLHFIGIKKIKDYIIKKAVEFGSFQNMKKLEEINYFKKRIMSPGIKKDPQSYKVRKGIIRGYTSDLREEDIKYIDKILNEMNVLFNKKK